MFDVYDVLADDHDATTFDSLALVHTTLVVDPDADLTTDLLEFNANASRARIVLPDGRTFTLAGAYTIDDHLHLIVTPEADHA